MSSGTKSEALEPHPKASPFFPKTLLGGEDDTDTGT